mmetsp:Transcript_135047/g.238074  ORF Transcript_135047/g.238074 Transcript_135047/m.238074 type:complete len:217 (+) Transcript_135047:101-751(+)
MCSDPPSNSVQIRSHAAVKIHSDELVHDPPFHKLVIRPGHGLDKNNAHGPLLAPLCSNRSANTYRLYENLALLGLGRPTRQIKRPRGFVMLCVWLLQQHALVVNKKGNPVRPAVHKLVTPLRSIDAQAPSLDEAPDGRSSCPPIYCTNQRHLEGLGTTSLQHTPRQQSLGWSERIAICEAALEAQTASQVQRLVQLGIANPAGAWRRGWCKGRRLF